MKKYYSQRKNGRHGFRKAMMLLALAGLLTACVPLRQTTTASPTPPPAIPTAAGSLISAVGVAFQLADTASNSPVITAGSTAHFLLVLVPSLITIHRSQDGTVFSVDWEDWKNSPSIQMKICFSASSSCTPGNEWIPFQPQISYDVPVDWLGERTFFAATMFRTSSGEIIPAGELYHESVNPAYSPSVTVTSIFPTTPGAGQLPSAVQTAQAATQVAFPVTGSILIDGGQCCAGGSEGTQIALNVQFQAASPTSKVTEMRITTGSCQRNSASLDAPWEPFVKSLTYTVPLMLNWSLFQLNVQYKDEKGFLSPVYCAQISLEGSPSP